MNYPIESERLHNMYLDFTREEPQKETGDLLSAIIGVVNKAYIKGVQDGMSRAKGE